MEGSVEEVVEFMIINLGVDANEVADTVGAHARFRVLEELYKDHL